MVYYTGDIHGLRIEVVMFCLQFNLTAEDTLIVLGNVGTDYGFPDEGCYYDIYTISRSTEGHRGENIVFCFNYRR